MKFCNTSLIPAKLSDFLILQKLFLLCTKKFSKMFEGPYLRVLTPRTTDGVSLVIGEDGKVVYKETHLPLSAKAGLEEINKTTLPHLQKIIQVVKNEPVAAPLKPAPAQQQPAAEQPANAAKTAEQAAQKPVEQAANKPAATATAKTAVNA